MEGYIDIFRKSGTTIAVEGNKPLLIKNPNCVWLVKKGKVDIFSIEIKDNEAMGARDFLFSVGEGDVLLGVQPVGEERKFGLLASGVTGTRLIQINLSKFQEIIGQGVNKKIFVRMINNWVSALSKSITTEVVPKTFLSLKMQQELDIPKNKVVRSKDDVIWIKHIEGKSLFNQNKQLDKILLENYFPLAESTWLYTTENSRFESIDTEKYLEDNTSLLELNYFNYFALQRVLNNREKKKKRERMRFKEKQKNDKWFVEKSITRLANVSKSHEDKIEDGEVTDDPLLVACRLVGKSMKIEIVPSPLIKKGKKSKDPLGDIVKASQIRMRQVILKGEWWRMDNGPLLGYMEKDNRPVALIPITPSSYELYDPTNRTRLKVNVQIAQGIKPFTFTFYRPFETRVLKLRDIFTFGIQSSWKRDLVMVVLMGIAGGLLGMLTPVATGIVFDKIIPEGEKAQLLQIGFFLGATALAGFLFQLTRSFAMLRMEGRMDGSIQAAVWDRLLSLPVPFFKQYSSGELAMRAMGISEIRRMLSGVTMTTILSSIFSIFNFALLFHYDVKLALFATLLVAVAMAVTGILGYSQMRYERRMIEISKKISGLVLQIIGGVSKFRVSGAENRAFYQWSKEFSTQRKITFKKELIQNWLKTFNSAFPVITSMIIFYIVISSTKKQLGAGNFIAFNSAFSSFLNSMVSLSETFLSINVIIPIYESAKPILEALPEYDEAKGDPGELTGEIEVSHISFRYKEDGPLILKDISLKINGGEYVALVGPSGSGKSTLFRILLGFEKTQAGQVYYNGQDINKVDIRSVRKQLGVVLQNGQLMSGDIFTNIIGSNPNLTMDDAVEAAKMAGLYEDIEEMPMGMHTVVSEGASTLSGGQRQRLLIARAIINKPRIIYFDEATSALDNRTQAIVSKSLDNLSATRIVIAHRLSTIVNCDRIIVLDKGRVIEDGTYEELMNRDGVFAELAKRQLA